MVKDDIKREACTTRATSFSTSTIGGARAGTVLAGSTIGETLFDMPAHALGSGDGDRVQRGKEFVANTSSDDLAGAKVYFPNWLAAWGAGTDTVVLTPGSAEDEGKIARLIGLDVDSEPITIDVELGGDGEDAISGDLMTDLRRVTIHDPETDDLVALVKPLTIARGNTTALGQVPEDFYSATGELDAWLPATLNDTSTATSAAADPSGASWSRPNSAAAGLAVATGTLTAGDAQGVWLRLTMLEGLPADPDIEYAIGVEGNDIG